MNKTDEGWRIETRKGRIEGGGRYETTEKVRVLSKENGRQVIEAIVIADMDIDRSGNKSVDRGKGYHYIALMEGKEQLSFANNFTKAGVGWRVLSKNCLSFVQDVKTKKEAIELLPAAAKGVSI